MGKVLAGYGYVYRVSDGLLVSEGTVIADPLPAGLALFERPTKHDTTTERWDNAVKAIVPFTDNDRIANIDNQIASLQIERARLLAGGP